MIFGRNDFGKWCRALKRKLLFYGVGGGQVLSPDELRQCYYCFKLTIREAFNLSSDVANGFPFEDAIKCYPNRENL